MGVPTRITCLPLLCCFASQTALADFDYKELAATKRDQPAAVTTTEGIAIPIPYGTFEIPKGITLKIISFRADGTLVAEYNGKPYSLPVGKTDLEKRVADIRSHRIVIDGVEYEDFEFSNPTVRDVTIKHRRGTDTVSLAKLPTDWQKKLGYDPAKEAELINEEQKRAQQEAAKTPPMVAKIRRDIPATTGPQSGVPGFIWPCVSLLFIGFLVCVTAAVKTPNPAVLHVPRQATCLGPSDHPEVLLGWQKGAA